MAHRPVRLVIGSLAIGGLSALGGLALVLGHDGSILGAVTGAIVAVVIATFRKSGEDARG